MSDRIAQTGVKLTIEPTLEHLDSLVSLEVDDDRSVLVTARDRPVIDADDPRSWFALALRYSAQFPQHGVGTGAQAQGVGKPGGRLTTEGVAQRAQRPSLRSRTTLIPTGQGVEVLGKRTTRAAGARTLEATHLNGENDPLLVPMPHVKSGKINVLAVASAKRWPGEPNIPTMEESGFPGFIMSSWTGLLAQAGTPAPVVERMAREIAVAMRSPVVAKKLTELGFVPVGSTSDEFRKLIERDIARYGQIVKAGKITLD